MSYGISSEPRPAMGERSRAASRASVEDRIRTLTRRAILRGSPDATPPPGDVTLRKWPGQLVGEGKVLRIFNATHSTTGYSDWRSIASGINGEHAAMP
jgi:hypothetical protein